MQRKIDSGHQHEQDKNSVEIGTVVVGNGSVFGGEPAGGHGGKGVADRFIEIHAAGHKQKNLEKGKQDIHFPQGNGGFLDAGFEFVRDRSGDLCLVKLHAADL